MGGGVDDSWMSSDHWKAMIRGLELLVLPPNSLEKGKWVKIKVNDQSCLFDDTFIKIPKAWGLRSFQFGEIILTPGRLYTPTAQGQKLLGLGFFQISPFCISSFDYSSLTFIISFNKLLNVSSWVLQTDVANQSNLRKGSWKTPTCSKVNRSVTWGPTTYNWHLKWDGSTSMGLRP